jgi:type IV pilus assembly protein PilF
MRRALWAALPLLLAACVTTEDRPSNPTDAARTNVQLGMAYMQQDNLKLAKEKLLKAEKLDPKSHEVYGALALLYERTNEPKLAERNYQKAMSLAPTNSQLVNNYAVFECRSGKVDAALPLFEKVIADKLYGTPFAAATNAGMCLRSEKRYADAVTYFERALAMRPDFVDAIVGLGDVQLTQGKPEAARKPVDYYLALGRKHADVLLIGVRAGVAQGDCAAVQNYARLVRRDFPNGSQARELPQMLGACAAAVK